MQYVYAKSTFNNCGHFRMNQFTLKVKIQTPVTSKTWLISAAPFVADGLKPLIGCDLFDQLGLAVTQSSSQKHKQVNNITPHYAFKKDSCTFW